MSDDIKIVGLLCNWCCYGGADTAGTARMQYPPNVRIIRVMCSGRINPSMVFKAFEEGADGVFVGGCHIGDCHYDAGNYKWSRRAKIVQDIIEEFGIEKVYYIVLNPFADPCLFPFLLGFFRQRCNGNHQHPHLLR